MRGLLVVAIVAILTGRCGRAPQAPTAVEPPLPSAPLTLDAAVRQGTLGNGLAYVIQRHATPTARAELRLVVDVGSILEDDDQLGGAHLLEHAAFSGSERFERGDLIATFEAMGMKLGPHINAKTGHDTTTYRLSVPTDDPADLRTALDALQDWAGGLSLTDEVIEKERAIVIEEWRRGLGASSRVAEALTDALFAGSKYATRPPIGDEDSLDTMNPDAVRRFYADWYRPDLMTVVVVGDIDPDNIEAEIRERFASLGVADDARPRDRTTIPHHDPAYSIVSDPYLPGATASIAWTYPDRPAATTAEYREMLSRELALAALEARVRGAMRSPDSRIADIQVVSNRFGHGTMVWSIGALSRDDDTVGAYEDLAGTVVSLVAGGVGHDELGGLRAQLLGRFESGLSGAASLPSGVIADRLAYASSIDLPIVSIEERTRLARVLLPDVSAADVQRASVEVFAEGARNIVIAVPSRPGLEAPTTAELTEAEARVQARAVRAPAGATAGVTPPMTPPPPGSVVTVDETTLQALGVTRWTLSNGIDVYWKRTEGPEPVAFGGYSPGGTSLVDDADWLAADTAAEIVVGSGCGETDMAAFGRWWGSRTASISLALLRDREGVSGTAPTAELGDALLVANAFLTAPRFDPGAFAAVARRRSALAVGTRRDVQASFGAAINATMYPSDPRVGAATAEEMEVGLSLDRSAAIYRDRFSDLHDMDWVFVGPLPDDFERLVTTWVATLPGGDRTEVARDRGHRTRAGPVEVTVHAGLAAERSDARLIWHAPFPGGQVGAIAELDVLTNLLESRLRNALREQERGVYAVEVQAFRTRHPVDYLELQVHFTADPDRIYDLVERAQGLARSLSDSPVPAEELGRAIEQERLRHLETAMTNTRWATVLSEAFLHGDDPVENTVGYPARLQSLTAEDIQAAAWKYLSTDNFVKGLRLPEAPAE